MFKTCSDPDFNWVHCLCDSATWVVKEPGKPIGFFYSRLFDDALSPSGLGFAVDAFRIDEDGTLDDFYSDILWDYGAADELIAAYPNKGYVNILVEFVKSVVGDTTYQIC